MKTVTYENGTKSLPRSFSGAQRDQGVSMITPAPVRSSSVTGVSGSQQGTTAGRYHTLPHASRKPLGGDHVFEVTLFKGQSGLGMNLSGGANEGPVIIKKIAKGTAADECGQLRVGDILLEINGKGIDQLHARDVIVILRQCPNEVQILVKRPAYGSSPAATGAYQQQVGGSSQYIGL